MVAPRMTTAGYDVDPGLSCFTIKAFAQGLLAAFGHNPTIIAPDLSGRVSFIPSAPGSTFVTLTIKTDSLTVVGDVNEHDRREIERAMRDEVLEVGKYPEITFRSTRVTLGEFTGGQARATIDGLLSLHGVTREERLDDVLVVTDGERIKGSGAFTILQSHYQIRPGVFAAGAFRLMDELACAFDIVAVIRSGSA
jgi:polyisoprenoid-binding protein YceI